MKKTQTKCKICHFRTNYSLKTKTMKVSKIEGKNNNKKNK